MIRTACDSLSFAAVPARAHTDAVLGDLPFAGSAAKLHQTPHVKAAGQAPHGSAEPTEATGYQLVSAQSARVLQSGGMSAASTPAITG